MPGSLRFRLPALFLLGIALAGALAALIALRLFQDYTRDEAFVELRQEAAGLARLYSEAALRAADEGENAPEFAAATLEAATGNRLFYVGTYPFPGQDAGLKRLPEEAIDERLRGLERPITFEFRIDDRHYLAAAQPFRLERSAQAFGALVVAKRRTELRDQWVPLVQRLALAFLVGIVVAGALSWYLSRRITGPVLALSNAADEIARGRYDVRVPPRGAGEIGHLAERFNEMAVRLGQSEERERQFLMSVSHELRTPLTAIKGHVDALRDGLIDDPELVKVSLDVVAAESTRLERLVGDVLDLAKLNAHRFTVLREEVDMGRLVEQAYSAFGEEARRREIDYELVGNGAGAPTIVSDGDRVLQVITNLLANAFRWTPDGGRIELGLESRNGAITVDVIDSGPGVPPEQRERIFRPFVSHDSGGTGLGLPIASELANALGGSIELETAVGAGSRFRLVLPGPPTWLT